MPLCAFVLLPPAAAVGTVDQPVLSDAPPLSLERALADLGRSPGAVAAAADIAALVFQHVGRPASAEEVAERIRDPRTVAEFFSITVADVSRSFDRVQAAIPRPGTKSTRGPYQLPLRVALEQAPRYFADSTWKPRQLWGDLYRYPIPSKISSGEVKMRSAFGEILDRLADNRGGKPEHRFLVIYRGAEYWDFDAFIDALAATGHQIEFDVSNEVSDFVHLMARQADGALREIQTDIRLRTGYFMEDQREIIVPAVHSHLLFRISGPDVNTAVEFYQGVSGTHFYPSFLIQGESWVGIRTSATYGHERAVPAFKAAGLYLDLLRNIARRDALFAGGYGQSGICSDSVAVIEVLLGVEPTVYPLLINKQLVLRHLAALQRRRPSLAARYEQIREAIQKMPSDITRNPSQARRILSCIPYGPGPTPHVGYNDARRALPK